LNFLSSFEEDRCGQKRGAKGKEKRKEKQQRHHHERKNVGKRKIATLRLRQMQLFVAPEIHHFQP